VTVVDDSPADESSGRSTGIVTVTRNRSPVHAADPWNPAACTKRLASATAAAASTETRPARAAPASTACTPARAA
jgi:hypothetical protein